MNDTKNKKFIAETDVVGNIKIQTISKSKICLLKKNKILSFNEPVTGYLFAAILKVF